MKLTTMAAAATKEQNNTCRVRRRGRPDIYPMTRGTTGRRRRRATVDAEHGMERATRGGMRAAAPGGHESVEIVRLRPVAVGPLRRCSRGAIGTVKNNRRGAIVWVFGMMADNIRWIITDRVRKTLTGEKIKGSDLNGVHRWVKHSRWFVIIFDRFGSSGHAITDGSILDRFVNPRPRP